MIIRLCYFVCFVVHKLGAPPASSLSYEGVPASAWQLWIDSSRSNQSARTGWVGQDNNDGRGRPYEFVNLPWVVMPRRDRGQPTSRSEAAAIGR